MCVVVSAEENSELMYGALMTGDEVAKNKLLDDSSLVCQFIVAAVDERLVMLMLEMTGGSETGTTGAGVVKLSVADVAVPPLSVENTSK